MSIRQQKREQILRRVSQAHELISGGLTVRKAIKQAGISPSSWHRYKDKANKDADITVKTYQAPKKPINKPKVKNTSKSESKVMALVGTASDVNEVLRGLL